MDVRHWTLKDLDFKKKGKFPEKERARIVEAVKKLNFKSFDDYSKNFEKALKKKLKNYTDNPEKCAVFKTIKSEIKKTGHFKHSVDLYNAELRIAIEVEKTKETTLLLDVVKFIVGYKRLWNGRPIIKYGVLIFPDRYRNRHRVSSQGSVFKRRIHNELAFINQILFIRDILLIEYNTSQLK